MSESISTVGERVVCEIGGYFRRSPPGNYCTLGGWLPYPVPQYAVFRKKGSPHLYNVRISTATYIHVLHYGDFV